MRKLYLKVISVTLDFKKANQYSKNTSRRKRWGIIYPHATTWRAMNDLKHRTCKHPHAHASSLIQLFQVLCKIFKMYKKIIFWWLLFMETFTLVTPDWLDWWNWSKIFSWLSHFSSQCVPTVSCNVSEPNMKNHHEKFLIWNDLTTILLHLEAGRALGGFVGNNSHYLPV